MLYAFMLLTPYGTRVWLPIVVVMAILVGVFVWLGWWPAVVGVLVVCLALLSFFRDPWRRLPGDLPPGAMLSPADGTVSAVLEVDHHPAIANNGPAKIIRIFLSVLNVHINRSPCDGEVVALRYTAGKFLNAQTEESAVVNESNLITMRIMHGDLSDVTETIGVRQVAGMIARAIVCPLRIGDRLKRGQKFGMIKFGSTTELILPRPADVTVHVKKGDKVKGGLTMIATLKPCRS
ncbi:MAG: phosphatidylserine decarboxylase [Phycisphaerales bacterium]|nr:phosphatidylserine decarboxylase [Phycisphaerales bacterium]